MEDVPGCSSGGSGDISGHDYCVDPEIMIMGGWSFCTSDSPCDMCTGDCDYDYDCAGDLKCFERDDFESVPGCKAGGSGD
jgi:hypothetical protein